MTENGEGEAALPVGTAVEDVRPDPVPPTPQEEDRRRLCRELKSLIGARIRHANRLKVTLASPSPGTGR